MWTDSNHTPAHPTTKIEFFLPGQFGPSRAYVGHLEGWDVPDAEAVFPIGTVVQLVPSASQAAAGLCSLPASHWNDPKSQALDVRNMPMHLLLGICMHTCPNYLRR